MKLGAVGKYTATCLYNYDGHIFIWPIVAPRTCNREMAVLEFVLSGYNEEVAALHSTVITI